MHLKSSRGFISWPNAAKVSMLLSVLIWGSAVVISKLVLEWMPPIILATIRVGIASIIMLPFCFKELTTVRIPFAKFTLLGFLGVTVSQMLLFSGLVYTSATSAGLIMGSTPALMLVLGVLFLKEKATVKRFFGAFISIIGVAIIVISNESSNTSSHFLGDLMIFGFTFSWAVYLLLAKQLMVKYSQIMVTTATLITGFIFLIPFSFLEADQFNITTISASTWFVVIYLGLISSGLAYLLRNYAVKVMPISEAGVYSNLSPFITAITAALALNEAITIYHLTGGALVIVGIFITNRVTTRPQL